MIVLSSILNTLLLIIVAIAVFLMLFFVMTQLDRFLDKGNVKNDDKIEVDLVLFGEADTLRTMLQDPTIQSYRIHTTMISDINQDMHFRMVAALSQNDIDNFMLCVQAKRMNQKCLTIALCNDTNHEKIFSDHRINRCFTSIPNASELVHFLKETHNEV